MAITSDVIVAVSSESANGGQRVRLANVNEQKFASSEFQLNGDGHADIDANLHDWTNYFKAGLNGACQLLRQEDADRGLFKSVGMDVLVHGTVPPGGGLSSSAALVCASALATLRAHGKNEIKKSDLVSLAMVSERTVGVNSGGYAILKVTLSTVENITDGRKQVGWTRPRLCTQHAAAHYMCPLCQNYVPEPSSCRRLIPQ